MELGGWLFTIHPASVEESVLPGEKVERYVQRLAAKKAQTVISLISTSVTSETLVIAADTAVVEGSEILGKPADEAEAERMLLRLCGRVHQVYTGLVIMRAETSVVLNDLCVTQVTMRNFNPQEMNDYIASGDPLDKAGAYAIQHPSFRPVEKLQGCYANVMGLPLCHLQRNLAMFSVESSRDIPRACQDFLQYCCPIYSQVLSSGW